MSFDVNAKQLQFLKETMPASLRVAVMRASGDAGEEQRWQLIRRAADTLGIALLSLEVTSQETLNLRSRGCALNLATVCLSLPAGSLSPTERG